MDRYGYKPQIVWLARMIHIQTSPDDCESRQLKQPFIVELVQLTIDDLIANQHIQRELEVLLYISRKPASRLTAKIDIEIIFLSTTTARKAEKI